jgi:hypothetical protein
MVLSLLTDAYNKYKEYKPLVDTAVGVGKAYLDYKDAKRRNEIEEAAYDDYMAAAEAAGKEAEAAVTLNLTPMTVSNLPTKKADVTSFTKATGVKDGGIMRLKDGTPDPNEGITALRKVAPDVVAKMGFAGGGGPGIEALRKKAPEVVKRMGFKEGMNEEMIETVSYEPGNYTDEEIEAYENYKYDMNEQKPGFPIMEIDDFLRYFMSPYSKKDDDSDMMMASEPGIDASRNELAMQLFGKTLDLLSAEEMEMLEEAIGQSMAKGGIASFAKGGRVKYAQGSGGIMDMGGMEKDYRFSGGFVPIGEYERKDDVPARLSKNEFVFTADAVRAAGGGSIQKGAKRMYDTMKNLEAKPQAKGMMA